MQNVKSFSLQEPEQYVAFRKYALNIIDWGKDTRLKQIRDSLDYLLEEGRRRTSEVAKSPKRACLTAGQAAQVWKCSS